MKKIVVILIIFIVIFGLTACKKEGISLYEATGIEIENIESAGCNTSSAQSYIWEFDRKFYKHLDVEYEIIDSNIRIFDARLIVYVNTNNSNPTIFYFIDDFIYFRNDNANTNYVSIKKTSIEYSKVT
jgi:hypothetical protein